MKRTRADLEKEFNDLQEVYRFADRQKDKTTIKRICHRLRILFNLLYPELK